MGEFVGIDLGTTYSAIAYINSKGKPEIIPNEYGHATTPSVIAFEAGKPIIGEEAKRRQASGDQEVASFFKRQMGDPNYLFSCAGIDYSAEELSTLVLEYLKRQAEHYLDKPVTDAVITVPAYFTHKQRLATINAGRKAGLNLLKVINEPTSAALAYGMRPGLADKKQYVLVYDLGGGTFDVSLVAISATELTVIASDGDHNLGGKDWDDRLVDYLDNQFQTEFGRPIIDDDIMALRIQVEYLKHRLTEHSSSRIRVQADGCTGVYPVRRNQFESLTQDLMERTKSKTEAVIKDAKLFWSDLSGVLPIGGSTRMPMVHAYIQSMSHKEAMKGINPDKSVALGAAIQAAMEIEDAGHGTLVLSGRKRTTDVIAHSLGMVAISDDGTRYVNSILIRKNRTIPSQEPPRSFRLPLSRRGHNLLEVFLTQGESVDPQMCNYLGRYVFDNFPFLPSQKEAVLDVSYRYDKNALVHISAVEHSTGKPLRLSVEPVPFDVPVRFSESPQSHRKEREDVVIYLAFDLSASMRGAPLVEAKKAAEEFARKCNLSYTSLGLISFSNEVLVNLEATSDLKDILKGIHNLTVGRTGWGNGGQPFTEIAKRLQESSAIGYAIVLTDGRWHFWREAIKEAKLCHNAGIEVLSIGFGEAMPSFLSSIASSSEQGKFVDMQKLTETYSTIAQEINQEAIRRTLTGLYVSDTAL